MQKEYKIIIVGAGPIGLYLSSLVEKRGFKYLLLEASDHVGGQLINLYPEKEIVDIPNIECIKAKDYISYLNKKLNHRNIKLNTTVSKIEESENGYKVITNNGEFLSEYVVLSTGLGFSKPRPMGIEGEEGTPNIIYSIGEYEYLRNKRVAILGGGDSALDWAKTLSSISDGISLIHRRMEFRGDASTIKDCKNLNVYLPYVPYSLKKENGLATILTIENVNDKNHIDIPVDYIFVNYGNIPASNQFDLEYEQTFVKVNDAYLAKSKLFAIGDIASYENKKRRIAPGIFEAEKIMEHII